MNKADMVGECTMCSYLLIRLVSTIRVTYLGPEIVDFIKDEVLRSKESNLLSSNVHNRIVIETYPDSRKIGKLGICWTSVR